MSKFVRLYSTIKIENPLKLFPILCLKYQNYICLKIENLNQIINKHFKQ